MWVFAQLGFSQFWSLGLYHLNGHCLFLLCHYHCSTLSVELFLSLS